MNRIVWRLLKGVGHALTAALGGIRVEGVVNVPKTGPLVVVANHLSDIDPPMVWVALPRPPWFMAKSELFEMKLLGPLIRWMQAFPVRRDAADRTALRFAEERLKEGEAVVIFPEGRLSVTGEMEAFQPGAALIALRSDATVIPAGIMGTPGMLPYGKLWPRRSKKPVHVRFGPPLELDDLAGMPRSEALKELTKRMEAAVAALAGRPLPTPDVSSEEVSIQGNSPEMQVK